MAKYSDLHHENMKTADTAGAYSQAHKSRFFQSAKNSGFAKKITSIARRLLIKQPECKPPPPPPPLPDPVMPPIWYLDWPDITKEHQEPAVFMVSGWIASVHPIHGPFFETPPLQDALRFEIKQGVDVEKLFGMPVIRFQGSCPMSLVAGMQSIPLFFETGGMRHEITVPVHQSVLPPETLKARKLAKILQVAACPTCRGTLEIQENACVCRQCNHAYARNQQLLDFLPGTLAKEASIAPTDNVSANLYNGICLNYIHAMPNGLILDCGAGCKNKVYENVVNLEIVDYASTDVLAVAEHLPFKEGVFDVVFSFAVLEHVRNPLAAAREMVRVLKPGGILFGQVPFLSPLHAYPHHYYNMTLAGLKALFEDSMEIKALEPLLFGQPIHALAWFLSSYLKGLPPPIAASFMDMRVRDLLVPADRYLGAPFVACLKPETREELACCNYIIAHKRDQSV